MSFRLQVGTPWNAASEEFVMRQYVVQTFTLRVNPTLLHFWWRSSISCSSTLSASCLVKKVQLAPRYLTEASRDFIVSTLFRLCISCSAAFTQCWNARALYRCLLCQDVSQANLQSRLSNIGTWLTNRGNAADAPNDEETARLFHAFGYLTWSKHLSIGTIADCQVLHRKKMASQHL